MRIIVGSIVLLLASQAWAVDYVEYQRLTARANSLLEATRTASEAALPGLRESAVEADLAVLDWLDTYINDPEFEALSPEQQTAVRSDRYRWEYNLSVQLVALERCAEAADRLRDLVSNALDDEELTASLIASYEEALVCQARLEAAQMCRVTFESATPGTTLSLDGEPIGPVPLTAEMAPGQYAATFEAPGHVAQVVRFTAEGEAVTVGPVTLVATAPTVEPSSGPEWYHWGLWGLGAVGVGTGVALFVAARDREDTVENPPAGSVITDLTAERETIDALDRGAAITGGIGLAAAITGLVLFLVADDEGEPAAVPTAVGGLPGLAITF